ncbi:hypothetical protein ACROYT_G037585 [Oculina patagonica]
MYHNASLLLSLKSIGERTGITFEGNKKIQQRWQRNENRRDGDGKLRFAPEEWRTAKQITVISQDWQQRSVR